MWASAGTKVLRACWVQALLLVQLPLSHVCQEGGGCFWTADLLSCSGLGLDLLPGGMPVSGVTLDFSHNRLTQLRRGSFQGLSRLQALKLAHNQVSVIHPGAFQNLSGPRLVHLDLSSNRLQALERHYFSELPGLQELLLFNNRIGRVEAGVLVQLGRLRRAYLSHNHITDFPFFSLQHQHQNQQQNQSQQQPGPSLLDLSSNRLPSLPLQDLVLLPRVLQRGLYLHSNPLRCDCATFLLLRAWQQVGFASVSDFQQNHVCLLSGTARATVRFLQNRRHFQRCEASVAPAPARQDGGVRVEAGRALLLHCAAALTGPNLTVSWVSPGQEDVVPPGNGGSLNMFANGSLEIVAAGPQDSGTYRCLVLDPLDQRHHTQEVNVTVVATRPHEPFSTGFSTLLGCLVSLVLVLGYLYLTPCRCPTCPTTCPTCPTGPTRSQDGTLACTQTSILSPAPPTTTEGPGHKVGTNKHVVFLEPIKEQQNGSLGPGPVGPGQHPDPLP